MSSRNNPRFHFKGPPAELAAEMVVEGLPGGPLPEVQIGEQSYVLQPQTGAEGSVTSLTLKLPPQTPPGKTEAVVHIGDKNYAAVIEVAEMAKVLAEPADVTLLGKPGSSTTAKVRVTNAGNVSRTIEGEQRIVLRHAGAISRGVRKAFHETSGDAVSRLIALGEHLSAEPVQKVQFDVKADFSTLAAGDERTVEILVRIPDEMDRSTQWKGSLTLLGMALSVTIDAQEKEGEIR
jgi:hypothetical protein